MEGILADYDRVFNENLFVYHSEIFSEEVYTLGMWACDTT